MAATGTPTRLERVRALAYLFMFGATLGVLTLLLLPHPRDTNVTGTLILAAFAAVAGAGFTRSSENFAIA